MLKAQRCFGPRVAVNRGSRRQLPAPIRCHNAFRTKILPGGCVASSIGNGRKGTCKKRQCDGTRRRTTFQNDFRAAELSDRRNRVMSKMGSGIAVVAAVTEVPGFDPFRQKSDFHYLTGVKVPHAYLILDASCGWPVRETNDIPAHSHDRRSHRRRTYADRRQHGRTWLPVRWH